MCDFAPTSLTRVNEENRGRKSEIKEQNPRNEMRSGSIKRLSGHGYQKSFPNNEAWPRIGTRFSQAALLCLLSSLSFCLP
jgi:hypothetical protein